MKTPRDYLRDVLEYLGYLAAFASEGRQQLETDIKTRLAISKAYEVIGEILKRIPDTLLSQQPHIRWREIKGFRDVLSHQYDSVNLDRVWAAIEDLPNLRTAVQALLDSLPTEDESRDEV